MGSVGDQHSPIAVYNMFCSLQYNNKCSKVTSGQCESSNDTIVEKVGLPQVTLYKGHTLNPGQSPDPNAVPCKDDCSECNQHIAQNRFAFGCLSFFPIKLFTGSPKYWEEIPDII